MPNEQNPTKAGIETTINEILSEKTFSNNEAFVVGVGGQTVFNTSKEIGGNVAVFEGGILTDKTTNVTGKAEVTTDIIPEGTTVNILY